MADGSRQKVVSSRQESSSNKLIGNGEIPRKAGFLFVKKWNEGLEILMSHLSLIIKLSTVLNGQLGHRFR
jgi:hypothetical protein